MELEIESGVPHPQRRGGRFGELLHQLTVGQSILVSGYDYRRYRSYADYYAKQTRTDQTDATTARVAFEWQKDKLSAQYRVWRIR